jgi:hypothetical protein
MFRATMCPSSGETSVALVTLYGWMTGMREHMLLHTRQSSTQNNKCQVPHKNSCFSWWWAHSCSKHVEIDKYTKHKHTKNKLCTKLALFTRTISDVFNYSVFSKTKQFRRNSYMQSPPSIRVTTGYTELLKTVHGHCWTEALPFPYDSHWLNNTFKSLGS